MRKAYRLTELRLSDFVLFPAPNFSGPSGRPNFGSEPGQDRIGRHQDQGRPRIRPQIIKCNLPLTTLCVRPFRKSRVPDRIPAKSFNSTEPFFTEILFFKQKWCRRSISHISSRSCKMCYLKARTVTVQMQIAHFKSRRIQKTKSCDRLMTDGHNGKKLK